MNKTPMIVTAGLLSILMAGASFAGPGKGCRDKAERQERSEAMYERLDLSEEQRIAVAELREKRRAERKAARAMNKGQRKLTATPDQADYQEQVEAFAKQKAAATEARVLEKARARAEFYALLTPEQQTQLLQMKEEKRAKRAEKRSKKRDLSQ